MKQENRFGTTVYVGNYYQRFVSQQTVIGEVGQLNDSLTHVPQEVVLSQHYVNLVVFAQPLSRDGGDTSVVRITDVQPDRFTLYVHEAPNEDGSHTTEAVSYLVLEAGQWELGDGTLLEVGTLDTADTVGKGVTNAWEQVDFVLPFSSGPVVLSQVQTENDPHWVKTRQKSVTTTGFQVALEEEKDETTSHGGGTIGWLAIETATGTWNGHKYEAAQTANAVTHDWYQINFSQSFGSAPRFVAALATYNGSDNAHLRYDRTSLTAGGVQVMVEEDTSDGSNADHTSAEAVAYLALQGNGELTAEAYVTGGADATQYYHAGGTRVAVRRDETLHWLLSDHLGSATVTADSSGNREAELRYKAWGETRYSWGNTPAERRFTGQIEDDTIGLYFYNARYYDPYLNRFISADSIMPDPGIPQAWNRGIPGICKFTTT